MIFFLFFGVGDSIRGAYLNLSVERKDETLKQTLDLLPFSLSLISHGGFFFCAVFVAGQAGLGHSSVGL